LTSERLIEKGFGRKGIERDKYTATVFVWKVWRKLQNLRTASVAAKIRARVIPNTYKTGASPLHHCVNESQMAQFSFFRRIVIMSL